MEAARAGNLRLENVSFAYPLRPNSGGVVLCYALPSRSIGKCTYLSTPVSISPSPVAFACSYATQAHVTSLAGCDMRRSLSTPPHAPTGLPPGSTQELNMEPD